MKIKFSQLNKALDKMRYDAGISNNPEAIIDVNVREEDIQKNVIGECLVATYSAVYQPSQYDTSRGPITKEFTLEIFADHENRLPRLTVVESRELDFKKD